MKTKIYMLAISILFFGFNAFSKAAQRLTIPTIDSIQLDTFLYLPEKVAPKAIVLVIGGSGFTNAGFGGPSRFAATFSENGFISVEWNKRGLVTNVDLTGITKEFSIYNTATIDKIYADARSVLLYMKDHYPALPIFVVGGSEGSVVTTLLAELNPQNIAAAATFGNVVMPFIQTSSMQLSDLFKKNVWKILDTDLNNTVDAKELSQFKTIDTNFLFLASANFTEIDLTKDGVLSFEELSSYVVNYFVNNHPDKTFWYTSSGVSTLYLDSMFRLAPLTSRSLNITTPVFMAQGEDDWNTPVKNVYDFQIQCKTLKKDNFTFKYYAKVGHAPSAEMLNDFITYFNNFLR